MAAEKTSLIPRDIVSSLTVASPLRSFIPEFSSFGRESARKFAPRDSLQDSPLRNDE